MVKGYVVFLDSEADQVKPGDFFRRNSTIVYSKPEDSLRFATLDQPKVIALVESDEKAMPFDSEYYDYYNMYNVNTFRVKRILEEAELVDRASAGTLFDARKMVKGYKFNDKNRELITNIHPTISATFKFYYDGDVNAFENSVKVKVKVK